MAGGSNLQGFGIDPLSLQDFKLDPAAAGSDYCYSPRAQTSEEEGQQSPLPSRSAARWQQQEEDLPVEEQPRDDWVRPLSRPSVMTQMIW